jgi:hypothetical protein
MDLVSLVIYMFCSHLLPLSRHLGQSTHSQCISMCTSLVHGLPHHNRLSKICLTMSQRGLVCPVSLLPQWVASQPPRPLPLIQRRLPDGHHQHHVCSIFQPQSIVLIPIPWSWFQGIVHLRLPLLTQATIYKNILDFVGASHL